MTTAKIKTLKESLHGEFSKIFNLCDFILSRSQRPSLIKVTLQVCSTPGRPLFPPLRPPLPLPALTRATILFLLFLESQACSLT